MSLGKPVKKKSHAERAASFDCCLTLLMLCAAVLTAYPGLQIHLIIKEDNQELIHILGFSQPVCDLLHGCKQRSLFSCGYAAQAGLTANCLTVPPDVMVKQLGQDIKCGDEAIQVGVKAATVSNAQITLQAMLVRSGKLQLDQLCTAYR